MEDLILGTYYISTERVIVMPSAAAHFALAYKIETCLNFRNDAFVYGCILPDMIDMASPIDGSFRNNSSRSRCCDPHYRKISAYCEVPDLERFWRENKLPDVVKLGYFTHLKEDQYFLEEFCPQHQIDDLAYFTSDKIYKDYTCLNPQVIQEFAIDLVRINRILEQDYPGIEVSPVRRQINIDWINNFEAVQLKPKYIKPNDYFELIYDVAEYTVQDLYFRQLAQQLNLI